VKSVMNPTDRSAVLERLVRLRPDAPRQWGRMSVGGMVCHLTDAFAVVLGERDPNRLPRFYERTLLRWFALHTPLPWPHGAKTVPACAQELGGTPPAGFEEDKQKLAAIVDRFVTDIDPASSVHPIFGRLSREEWGSWAWRHLDHHLRQFDA
jgi:hypothetical protein